MLEFFDFFDFFDPTLEQQIVVLVGPATLRTNFVKV